MHRPPHPSASALSPRRLYRAFRDRVDDLRERRAVRSLAELKNLSARMAILDAYRLDIDARSRSEWGDAGRALTVLARYNPHLTPPELAGYAALHRHGSLHAPALVRAASDPLTPPEALTELALNGTRAGIWWTPLMGNPSLPVECRVLLALGVNS